MTLTTWLIDQGILEKVGGISKLAQLVDRTVVEKATEVDYKWLTENQDVFAAYKASLGLVWA